MQLMKLGSKPEALQNDGENVSELASDIRVVVGNVKFHLHKVHPSISNSERRRFCKQMNCRKLSPDACMHDVQNEQLPLHVIVQVLFFEQERAAASFGSSTSNLPKGIRNLNSLSRGSSQSGTTANNDDDWDAVTAAEELRALKAELASLRLGNVSRVEKNGVDRTALKRGKGTPRSRKIFAKMLLGKGLGENSGSSDSSESLGYWEVDFLCFSYYFESLFEY